MLLETEFHHFPTVLAELARCNTHAHLLVTHRKFQRIPFFFMLCMVLGGRIQPTVTRGCIKSTSATCICNLLFVTRF